MAIDTPTTAGDKYLENSQSEYNATVVQKLLDEGAILIGKTNMDSWGFGSTTENSAYGVTKNPFDKSRVAGGSSGGSAAAIALDMCVFAIGEDTGGSVRNPAAYCGVYGYKPTYGIISRYGCIAYASSLDSVGIFGNTAEDLSLVLEIISGEDDRDMTVENYEFKITNYELKKKFAYSMDFIPENIDEEIRKAYLKTIEKFKDKSYEPVEIKLESFKSAIPTYYITAMSEASTNLSRYQGTRYGNLAQKLEASNYNFNEFGLNSWEELFTKSRTNGFTDEAKRRIFMGAYVLSEGYFDAYYKKAQKIRNKLLEEIEGILEQTDFILSPVTPSVAPKIGASSDDPISMYLEDIYTVTANLAGVPAISFPAGENSEGMPIGMQIIGEKLSDKKLINILNN
jgi:aspartyl-tRNA(Asn)/glutamyl-tRNA(Gln) amidotransferase subunit A